MAQHDTAFDDVPNSSTDSTSQNNTANQRQSVQPALARTRDGLAERKAMLAQTEAPYHVLDALGVDIPHRDYIDDADDMRVVPTTVEIDDTRVHLHQNVREDTGGEFGDFGAVSEDVDEDDVVWTVVGLDDGTVELTVVGQWSRRRSVSYDEFSEEYEPVYLADGDEKIPKFGY